MLETGFLMKRDITSLRLLVAVACFLLHNSNGQQCDITQDDLIIDWADVFSGGEDALFYNIDVTQLSESIGSNDNPDNEILNVVITADYKVRATYSTVSQNTQFGITYIIDTKPFGSNSDSATPSS